MFFVEWADWQTQYNIQLLSGDDNVDLIGTATDWLYAWENAEKGAFLPLSEDMLKANAPKTWAQVDADGHWDLTKLADGKIYFMPEDNYTQYTNHGFFYRGDWAKEAGLRERRDHQVRGLHQVLRVGQGQQAGRLSVGRRAGVTEAALTGLHPGPHRLPDAPGHQRAASTSVPHHRRPIPTRSPRGTWTATR